MKPDDAEMLLVKVEKLEFSGIIVLEMKQIHSLHCREEIDGDYF